MPDLANLPDLSVELLDMIAVSGSWRDAISLSLVRKAMRPVIGRVVDGAPHLIAEVDVTVPYRCLVGTGMPEYGVAATGGDDEAALYHYVTFDRLRKGGTGPVDVMWRMVDCVIRTSAAKLFSGNSNFVRSSLFNAAAVPGGAAVVRRLLDAGAEPHQRTVDAALIAAAGGDLSGVRALLDVGHADAWVSVDIGAVDEQDRENAIACLVRGTNLHELSSTRSPHASGLTALHVSAASGNLDVVCAILEAMDDRERAIHLCADMKHGFIGLELRPVDVAAAMGHRDVVALLRPTAAGVAEVDDELLHASALRPSGLPVLQDLVDAYGGLPEFEADMGGLLSTAISARNAPATELIVRWMNARGVRIGLDKASRFISMFRDAGEDLLYPLFEMLVQNGVRADYMITDAASRHCEVQVACLLRLGALPLLVAQLAVGTPGEKERAAGALGALAAGNIARAAEVATAGAVPPLVALLSGGTPGAKEHAVVALVALAYRSCIASAAQVAAGAVRPLVTLLVEGTPVAKERAAGALWYLVAGGDGERLVEVAADVVAAGAVPHLVALLSAEGTPAAKECAAGALWSLTAGSEARVAQIAAAGAVPPLVALRAGGSACASGLLALMGQ